MDFKIYKSSSFTGAIGKITTKDNCILLDQECWLDYDQIGPDWKSIIDAEKATSIIFPNEEVELDESLSDIPDNVEFYFTDYNKQTVIDFYRKYSHVDDYSCENLVKKIEGSKTLSKDKTTFIGDIKVTPIILEKCVFAFLIEGEGTSILWTNFRDELGIKNDTEIIESIKNHLDGNKLDYILLNEFEIDVSTFVDDSDFADRISEYMKDHRKVFFIYSYFGIDKLHSMYRAALDNNIKTYVSKNVYNMINSYNDTMPLDLSSINILDINNWTKEMNEDGFLIILDGHNNEDFIDLNIYEDFIKSFKGENCSYVSPGDYEKKAEELGFDTTQERFCTTDICMSETIEPIICAFIKDKPKIIPIYCDNIENFPTYYNIEYLDYIKHFVNMSDEILTDINIIPDLVNLSSIIDIYLDNESDDNLSFNLFLEFKDKILMYIASLGDSYWQVKINNEDLGYRKEQIMEIENSLNVDYDTYISKKHNLLKCLKSYIEIIISWCYLLNLNTQDLEICLRNLRNIIISELIITLKDDSLNCIPEFVAQEIYNLQGELIA